MLPEMLCPNRQKPATQFAAILEQAYSSNLHCLILQNSVSSQPLSVMLNTNMQFFKNPTAVIYTT